MQSELAVKSAEMEKLRSENKSLANKYVQLKRKHNLTEDDSAMVSQSTMLDSPEQDPEVCDSYMYLRMYVSS